MNTSTHSFARRLSAIAALCAAACVLSSCSLFTNKEISVKPATPAQSAAYYHTHLPQSGDLAFDTKNFLGGNLLQTDFAKTPRNTLEKLNEYYKISGDPRYFIIAADLCRWLAGRATLHEAIKFNLTSLFYCREATRAMATPQAKALNTQQYDLSSYRLIPIYNEACGGIFSYLKKLALLDHNAFTLLDAEDRRFEFTAPHRHLSVPENMVVDYSLCSDFTIESLMLINRQAGLGVPLVASISDKQFSQILKTPPHMTIPVTLLIDFTDSSEESYKLKLIYQDTNLKECLPVERSSVPDGAWPLALDFSTPLACFLNAQESTNLLEDTLKPFQMEKESGLYMLDPYQPGKIPVIFVHGLLSSPNTWMQMINFLKNNAEIRSRYQFWFYYYSSGLPVIISASGLRESLLKAYKDLAVTPKDKATFEKTIIVGHSMGGLVTRTLLQKDPHYFTEAISGKKWDDLVQMIPEEHRAELIQLASLDPIPFVHRAVFMAVPHRGAEMASWSMTTFASSIVKLPQTLLDRFNLASKILEKLQPSNDTFAKLKKNFVTGLDNLNPDTSFVQIFSKSPMKDDLKYHSIIGNAKQENVPSGSDGIVPYTSSHLDNAESELIVKSGHSVHRNPAAMKELMRILVLNLQEKK